MRSIWPTPSVVRGAAWLPDSRSPSFTNPDLDAYGQGPEELSVQRGDASLAGNGLDLFPLSLAAIGCAVFAPQIADVFAVVVGQVLRVLGRPAAPHRTNRAIVGSARCAFGAGQAMDHQAPGAEVV